MTDEEKAAKEKEEADKKKAESEKEETKSLTKEQVAELLAAARKEEKDKLYPQLDEVRTSLKEVQEAFRAEKEEKERIKAEAEKRADDERKAKLSSEDIMKEGLAKIEEQLASERKAREELQTKLETERRNSELSVYIAQKIQEAKGEILPELVRGTSEAEIDAATEIAKARYAEIVESVKAANGKTVREGMPRPASPDTAAHEEAELAASIDDIQIDPKRYAKDKEYRAEIDTLRDKVQAQVEAAYKKSVGQV